MYNKKVNRQSLIKFMEESGFSFTKKEAFRNNENKITFDVFYFTNDKFEIMRITFSRLDAEYSFSWKQYTDSCLQCGWKIGYGLREFKNNFEYHLNNVLTVYCK